MMKELLNYIKSSFDNNTIGASARKLSAFWIMLIITFCDVVYMLKGEYTEFNTFIIIHFVAMFLLLGLVTTENIIKFFKKD